MTSSPATSCVAKVLNETTWTRPAYRSSASPEQLADPIVAVRIITLPIAA